MKRLAFVCGLVFVVVVPSWASRLEDAGAKWAGGDKAGAVAVWRAIVEDSTDPKEVTAARMKLANACWAAGDVSSAVAQWQAVAAGAAEPAMLAESKLRLANATVKSSAPIADQIAAFLRVANEHPNAPQAGQCLLRAAYLRDKAEPKAGAAAFGEVVSRYPGTKEAAEASYRKGLVLERKRADIDGAIDALALAAATVKAGPMLRQQALVEAGYARIMKYMGSALEVDLKAAAEYFKETLPRLSNPDLAARALLGLGECYLLSEKFPIKNEPPTAADLAEQEARDAEHYAVQAEKAYQFALSTQCSDYVKVLAQYGVAYSLMRQDRWEEAAAAFGKVLSAIPGESLCQKRDNWRKLAVAKASTGSIAASGLHVEWKHLVVMAAYWRGDCLDSAERKAEARAVFQQIVDEFGHEENPHCFVRAAERALAEMAGGAG